LLPHCYPSNTRFTEWHHDIFSKDYEHILPAEKSKIEIPERFIGDCILGTGRRPLKANGVLRVTKKMARDAKSVYRSETFCFSTNKNH
jgi:hypothetical protein